MVYSVSVFFNTGFDHVNIPYDGRILKNVDNPIYKQTFNSIYVLQNRGLTTIRLQATWEEIKGADYVLLSGVEGSSIDDTWYFVDGVSMINENTAEIHLSIDALTSIGIPNINIQTGWCTRRHVRDDTIFSNIMSEDWAPENELVLDAGSELKISGDGIQVGMTIVGCTFNLMGDFTIAQEFKVTDTSEEKDDVRVAVPLCPSFSSSAPSETTVAMNIEGVGITHTNTLPNLKLFNLGDVEDNINKARSLSLDTGITCAYKIPPGFLNIDGTTYDIQGITKITNNTSIITTSLNYEYDTVKNKKALTMYNTYILSSICSGDRKEYSAANIYHEGDVAPKFLLWADVSPNGKPFARPEYFMNNKNDVWMECVAGCVWQNSPISYDFNRGYDLKTRQYKDKADDRWLSIIGGASNIDRNEIVSGIDQLKNIGPAGGQSFGTYVSGLSDIAMGSLGFGQRLINWGIQSHRQPRDFKYNELIVAPEITFPREDSIQNFIGNSFWIQRRRLGKNDLNRLDDYLNAYGYHVDEPLTLDCFNCRQVFNYVVGRDVSLAENSTVIHVPIWLRNIAAKQIESGVRIWHNTYQVLPNKIYENNPINTTSTT